MSTHEPADQDDLLNQDIWQTDVLFAEIESSDAPRPYSQAEAYRRKHANLVTEVNE